MTIEERINSTISEIKGISKKLVVAFSGGKDSTLVATLSREALGKENVKLLNVCFGPYSYSRGLEIVINLAEKLDLDLMFTAAYEDQEEIWKYGPSCNRCTKLAKFNAVLKSTTSIIATGANLSDTWGQTGIALKERLYAPIRDWSKNEINEALKYFSVEVPRIGEAPIREGCKLKHLLKMMANPSYHGQAVAISNEILLDHLSDFPHEMANVKIIGPLSRNIALVNVLPMPSDSKRDSIAKALKKTGIIDTVHWVDKPIKVIISANPGIFNNESSKKWILKGRLQPEFAAPISAEWIESRNRRLATFQIIDYTPEVDR
ncbi:ExsB family protein [Kosmotoga arenicorallina S304]|uniref:ExsB family protein n=1 Tax=Kosmotoga arenicorallina S304 TaxID=1453497 RepID=A0A176K3H0_9BACT|nr:ExsB family protein [Kosmotoga arenicorallina]OAA31865.1 ExsB family protein [Kosmotoga arenicorallina S304]